MDVHLTLAFQIVEGGLKKYTVRSQKIWLYCNDVGIEERMNLQDGTT